MTIQYIVQQEKSPGKYIDLFPKHKDLKLATKHLGLCRVYDRENHHRIIIRKVFVKTYTQKEVRDESN